MCVSSIRCCMTGPCYRNWPVLHWLKEAREAELQNPRQTSDEFLVFESVLRQRHRGSEARDRMVTESIVE